MITLVKNGDILELALGFTPCNEIGSALAAELERVLTEVRADMPKTLLVHSTVPGGFSAGANLRELYAEVLKRPKKEAMQELGLFLDRIHRVMNSIDTLPCPVISVVHGVCFGGGFELALTSDVIVAESSARFCFPELRLGIIPGFGGIPRLRRDVGNSLIRDLLFTGRSINAEKALQVGLVSQVVQTGKGLEIARKMAAQMSRYDARVMSQAKSFIKALPLEELEKEKDLFLAMFEDPVVMEGLKKFVESSDLRPYLA